MAMLNNQRVLDYRNHFYTITIAEETTIPRSILDSRGISWTPLLYYYQKMPLVVNKHGSK